MKRREFVAIAAALGASAAWARGLPAVSRVAWRERRDLFPEGVASGDPQSDSILLWTRYPAPRGTRARLTVEVAEDEGFQRVVATASAVVAAAAEALPAAGVVAPPLAALTACWQLPESFDLFFSRHCSAGAPPVGTPAQTF